MDQWEDLERRVAALEAAAAPTPQPDEQRLAYLTSWLRGYIGPKSLLSADGAESLARQLLANRILTGAPAPMEWPELPREVPECLLPDGQSSILRPFAFLVWRYAHETLAAMNPNRQGEGQGND
jgi:hypothetical protein